MKAFITGITGQDGSYLAELLLEKDYEVHGLVRRSSTQNISRIKHLVNNPKIKKRFILHEGDLIDFINMHRIIEHIKPNEIYNLAAISNDKASFEIPIATGNSNGIAVLKMLEIIRMVSPTTKFFQASSSELFGKASEKSQTESTPFYPRSPYGIAKLYAHWSVVNYREAYNLHACSGILFNHESPRRGEDFVTKKIASAAARIKHGLQECLFLGNIDAQRDWGYAKDYVEGMWLLLQHPSPEDFVLATGISTSVRKFLELTFSHVGCILEWIGEGISEKGIDKKTGKTVVEIAPHLFRHSEEIAHVGNATKAQEKLGWKPATSIEKLAEIMVQAELDSMHKNTKYTNSLNSL